RLPNPRHFGRRLAAAQPGQERGGAGQAVRVGGAAQQLGQQEPLAVRQPVGGDVVGAVVEADPPGVDAVEGGEQRAADVLVVADDFAEDAGGAHVGGVEVGDDGDTLAAGAEEEGGVADHGGADDQVHARV